LALSYLGLIPALWIAWLIYWAGASASVKPTRRKESARSRLSYTAPLLLGALLLASPHWTGPLDVRFVPLSAALFWIAIALVATGLGFTVAARIWLGRNWSADVTLKQDHELIRAGPYRYVRHPIYSGLLLAFVGTALAIGEWRALVALVLVAASFIRKIAIEEQFLAGEFGEAHARYAAAVPALIPFVY
jgi:protein-S-isoprenylcysteine O-methyltransferase Ste14